MNISIKQFLFGYEKFPYTPNTYNKNKLELYDNKSKTIELLR